MKKRTPTIAPPPQTEYQKLTSLLSMYEKILHPDVFNPIMKQLSKVYDELKLEAYAKARITPEARKIEQRLLEMKRDIDFHPQSASFFYKTAFRAIVHIITHPDEQTETTEAP